MSERGIQVSRDGSSRRCSASSPQRPSPQDRGDGDGFEGHQTPERGPVAPESVVEIHAESVEAQSPGKAGDDAAGEHHPPSAIESHDVAARSGLPPGRTQRNHEGRQGSGQGYRRPRVQAEFPRRPQHHLPHPEGAARGLHEGSEEAKHLRVGHARGLSEPVGVSRRPIGGAQPQATAAAASWGSARPAVTAASFSAPRAPKSRTRYQSS